MSATPEQEKILGHDTAQAVAVDEEKPPVIRVTVSRETLRKNKLLGNKIMKKFHKGHSPRKIAHELGYINVNEGERVVEKFIRETLKQAHE